MLTPLRYPGGKARLGAWLSSLLRFNGISGGTYVEAYAGGAGAAIYLLLNEYVADIVINDIDPAIHAFWHSALHQSEGMIQLIGETPLTLEEWRRQREIYITGDSTDALQLGFAAFYLNRTNRSGIIKAGIIGGKGQDGKYKMDARFNRTDLQQRVRQISKYRSRVQVYSEDAVAFITRCNTQLSRRSLIYLDPPYYQKGSQLYANFYKHQDHVDIAETVRGYDKPLIVTYDSCEQISDIYAGFDKTEFNLIYSTHEARPVASELLIYKNVNLPDVPFMSRTTRPLQNKKPAENASIVVA